MADRPVGSTGHVQGMRIEDLPARRPARIKGLSAERLPDEGGALVDAPCSAGAWERGEG